MRVLLLNLGSESVDAVDQALRGQGYDIGAEQCLSVDQVLAHSPDILVTDLTGSDCARSSLIAELKAIGEGESSPKVVIIAAGGATERARALDLGADEVISFPFDPVEFAARIRAQFRERQPQEKLKHMLQSAVQRERLAEVALSSAGVFAKGPVRLIPAIFALSVAALIGSIYLSVSGRGARKETRRLRAEIARLDSGLGQEDDLLRRVQLARVPLEAQSTTKPRTQEYREAHSEDSRDRGAPRVSNESFKHELAETQHRLKLLENQDRIAETVVHDYGPSVCLLHITVEFFDNESGRALRIVADASGKPIVDDKGLVQVDDEGTGPRLQVDVFGTGFLARSDGKIITNHHVVEPWWKDNEMKQLLDHGARANVSSYEVYFPKKTAGLRAKLDRISTKADVATLQLEVPIPQGSAVLEFDDRA